MQLKGLRGQNAIKNILRVYSSQLFKLAFSFFLSFYIPKYIGVEEFAYWQLFLFYANYTGLLQLGLNDGLYLRLGGTDPSNEEKRDISSQLWIQAFVLTLLAIIATGYVLIKPFEQFSENFIFISVAIYAVIYNIYGYCVSICQAVNQFKVYTQTLIQRNIIMTCLLVVMIWSGIKQFEYIVIIYTATQLAVDLRLIFKHKDLFWKGFKINKTIWKEIKINISAGINLMLSNIASSLIVGICRFFISILYPIVTFGYVSFSFTLTNFVLVFLAQAGTAIYPILKSKDSSFHKQFYPNINTLLSVLLPFSILLLPLIFYIVTHYIPKYENSLIYLAYLYPICFFETKLSSLYNTYMKVLRKERLMLILNIVTFITSLIFAVISLYILDNIELSICGIIVSIILKAILYHIYIRKEFNVDTEIINFDIILTVVYYLMLFTNVNLIVNVSIIAILNAIFCFMKRRELKQYVEFFLKRR